MRVLFIISALQDASTVFNAAAKMAEKTHEIYLLFINKGCRHVTDQELLDFKAYARGVYYLEQECVSEGLQQSLHRMVEPIDYSGWIKLLEHCDTVISWS